MARGQRDARVASHRFDRLVAGTGEQVAHDAAVVLVVFDDQDRLGHGTSEAGTAAPGSFVAGSVKQNVAPASVDCSSHNRPPCSSTMRREIARPSPEPALSLVLESSAC